MMPVNDNLVDQRLKLIELVLGRSKPIRDRLDDVPALLANAGVDPRAQEAVLEYLRPVAANVDELERGAIRIARSMPTVLNGALSRMEMFMEEFERLAVSPDQVRLAANFREFVAQTSVAWGVVPLAAEVEPADRGVRHDGRVPTPANDGPEIER